MRYEEWYDKAACAFDSQPDDWYASVMPDDVPKYRPNIATRRELDKSLRAIQICNMHCPVRQQCENWILNSGTESEVKVHGIWAGMTENQRRRIYRKRRAV